MKTRTLLLAVLLTAVLSVVATYLTLRAFKSPDTAKIETAQVPVAIAQPEVEDCCKTTLYRDVQSAFVKPLLFAEDPNESEYLASLKQSLLNEVDGMKKSGSITRASLYLKDLNTMRWVAVNGDDAYYPGSMLKVALMIHMLHLSESDPTLLEKKVLLEKNLEIGTILPPSQRLQAGKEHTVKELIEALIVRSDNDAANLLQRFIRLEEYQKMYYELGLTPPAMDDFYYQISPKEYTRFFRVLYNATFLNRENSEYAMGLLNKAEYKNGLTKFLPKGALAAHKFGERFTESTNLQFHESGVISLGGKAYVLTIMTEGSDFNKLQNSVADLGKVCHEYFD